MRVGETTLPLPDADPLDVTLRPIGDTTLDALTGGDVTLGDPVTVAPVVAARPTPVGGTGKGLDPVFVVTVPVLVAPTGFTGPGIALGLIVPTGLPTPDVPALADTVPCLANEAAVGANKVEAGRVRIEGAGIPLGESSRA